MTFPFQDPDLPLDDRVGDLVARLTLEEKVACMMHDSPAIERLGIPAYNWWNECSHGVARAGVSTVFPHAIALAATFDAPFLREIGSVVADEARAKHHEASRLGEHGMYQGLTFWTPNINIVRDPRWGRGMETFGEDPHLTGTLAVAYIRGLEGNDAKYLKTAACAKHFAVHSGPEPRRHEFDARVDARDLHETYLPAFRACVVEARVAGVMGAYNRLNGEPCCAHPWLNGELLRKQWGFEGYYVSDVGAIVDIWKHHRFVATQPEACGAAVRTGCDLNGGWEYVPSLVEAVEAGLVTEEEIDVCVKRLFRTLFRLGHFDPPERVPFASVPHSVVNSPGHLELAREAVRRSVVLLKNDGVLPFERARVRRIAVVGPNAASVRALLGNYFGTPAKPMTLLDGIRAAAGPEVEVIHHEGCRVARATGDLEAVPPEVLRYSPGPAVGLAAEYFDGAGCEGDPVMLRIERNVDFNWGAGLSAGGVFPSGRFSARWSGWIVPPRDGVFRIGVVADTGIRLYLNGKLAAHKSIVHGAEVKSVVREGRRNERVAVRVEYDGNSREAYARLLWLPPEDAKHDSVAEAAVLAGNADVIVACVGLTGDLEGEEGDSGGAPGFVGGDRTSLDLPGRQQELLDALCDTGRPVVAVVLTGSAVNLARAQERCRAVLCAWYPGGEGGAGVADVLFGRANPGGRLPVTFYRTAEDLPPFEEYAMEGRTYRFFRGEAVYPFGYGLSYTRFRYRDLRIAPRVVPTDGEAAVTVEVANAGAREGDEVVQLYVQHRAGDERVPLRALAGIARVRLGAGESREVRFALDSRALSRVLPDGRRVAAPGRMRISVGGRQPDVSVPDDSTTEVLSAETEVTGPARELEP